jgi:hypothetical protein
MRPFPRELCVFRGVRHIVTVAQVAQRKKQGNGKTGNNASLESGSKLAHTRKYAHITEL